MTTCKMQGNTLMCLSTVGFTYIKNTNRSADRRHSARKQKKTMSALLKYLPRAHLIVGIIICAKSEIAIHGKMHECTFTEDRWPVFLKEQVFYGKLMSNSARCLNPL